MIMESKPNFDPRTLMLVMFCLSWALMLGDNLGPKIYWRLIILVVPGLFIWKTSKQDAFVYLFIILIAWIFESFYLSKLVGWYTIPLMAIANIVTRFYPILSFAKYFWKVTKVEKFALSLRKMKFPSVVVIPMTVMFRFFPTIKEEATHIREAMRIRLCDERLMFKRPLLALEAQVIPLMSSVLRIGDELSMSVVTRGLSPRFIPTSIEQIAIKYYDYLVMLLAIALVGAYLWL